MVIMSIKWHTSEFEPDRTCPICRPLDGFVWTFDSEKEPFPTELFSHRHGVRVWDLIRDEPRPHGQHKFNCRCRLEIMFDPVEIEEAISKRLTWAYQLKVLLPVSAVAPT